MSTSSDIAFFRLTEDDSEGIAAMSAMATEILKEHYDSILGAEQNDYMLRLFQTPEAIASQLSHGYRYYFVQREKQNIGFIAFFPRGNAMYLSKLYLYKSERGKGYAHKIISFVSDVAHLEGLKSIELNANKRNNACQAYEKMGSKIIRSEKNDIGNGFFMDDYVYSLTL